MTVKSSARVGYLNAILAQGGGNLNNSIFKSSNARGLPGGGGGMLMFRIDRRIKWRKNAIQVNSRLKPRCKLEFVEITGPKCSLTCFSSLRGEFAQ